MRFCQTPFFSKLIKKLIKLIRYTEQVRWHYIHYLYYIWPYNRQPHCFTQEINTRHLQFTNTDLLTSEQQIIYPEDKYTYITPRNEQNTSVQSKTWFQRFHTEKHFVFLEIHSFLEKMHPSSISKSTSKFRSKSYFNINLLVYFINYTQECLLGNCQIVTLKFQ